VRRGRKNRGDFVCSCDMIVTEPLAVKVSSEAKSLQYAHLIGIGTLILSTKPPVVFIVF
jgi:hypothetical protein